MWAKQLNAQNAQNLLSISSNSTIKDWYNFMRDTCTSWIQTNRERLDGVGDIVEIDECKIGRKRKYGRGDIRGMDQWVFGMVERRRGIASVIAVDDRKAETLLPIIQEHVVPGTTIHSDEWAAYNRMHALGYHHRTVNHSQEFVAEDGTNTNTIEGLWGNLRCEQRIRRGTSKPLIQSRLDEFCMRTYVRKNNIDMFELTILHIANMYPQ